MAWIAGLETTNASCFSESTSRQTIDRCRFVFFAEDEPSLEEMAIDDSISLVGRLKKYVASDLFLHRYVRTENPCCWAVRVKAEASRKFVVLVCARKCLRLGHLFLVPMPSVPC